MNNGTLMGSPLPSWVAGKYGSALSFNGANYVEVPNSPSLKNFSAMTLLMWVKVPAFTGVYRTIVDGGFYNSPFGYLIYCNTTSNIISFALKNTAGVGVNPASVPFTPDTWMQIGFVWIGANVYSIKNGVLSAAVAFSGTMDPTSNIRLGQRLTHVWGYNGAVDTTHFFNRGLSPQEIKDDYNNFAPRNGLVAEYMFDAGVGGTIAYDAANISLEGIELPMGNISAQSYFAKSTTLQWQGGVCVTKIKVYGSYEVYTINCVENNVAWASSAASILENNMGAILTLIQVATDRVLVDAVKVKVTKVQFNVFNMTNTQRDITIMAVAV
jgi:hypothetical protein